MLENEIGRYFHDNEKALKDNIRFRRDLSLLTSFILTVFLTRLLHIGGPDTMDPIRLFKEYAEGFAKMYPIACAEGPLTCTTGRVFPGAPRPDVIILDVSLRGSNKSTKHKPKKQNRISSMRSFKLSKRLVVTLFLSWRGTLLLSFQRSGPMVLPRLED